MLDIPDNLERAAASVPEEALLTPCTSTGTLNSEETEKLRRLLRGLLDGVIATEKILLQVRNKARGLQEILRFFQTDCIAILQVMRKQGVEQYNPVGDKFDPNLHSALFEVPDPSKEAGYVAIVTKVSACF